MGSPSWLCWVPNAMDWSKRRQSETAGRKDERPHSQKRISERRKEGLQTSQSRRQGAASIRGVAWYERILAGHTEPASRGQTEIETTQSKAGLKRIQEDAPQAQVPKSRGWKHKGSTADESKLAPCKKGSASPSRDPLIRAVPGKRPQARQESFRVETSWLAVADVSFADMLQAVDVAGKQHGQQSRPCEDAFTECTLVFPKLKGRVSDSGCRGHVSKKTAVTPIHSPRPPSNLREHTQCGIRSSCAEKSQPAPKLSSAACSSPRRPCKAEAARTRLDASRPTRPQRSAGSSPDKHQDLIQGAALAHLPGHAKHPSSQQSAVCT